MRSRRIRRCSRRWILVCGLLAIAGCATTPPAARKQGVVFPTVTVANPLRQPQYPDVSRRKGDQGLVGVDVFVGKDGRVKETKIVMSSGHQELDAATLKEASTWRFVPGRLNDELIEMWNTFIITFSLYDKNRPMPDQSLALAEMQKMIDERKATLVAKAAIEAAP
jgi:TonB family protein